MVREVGRGGKTYKRREREGGGGGGHQKMKESDCLVKIDGG